MNNQQQPNETFNTALDELLAATIAQQTMATPDDALLQIAQQIATTDLSQQSRIRHSLRRELLTTQVPQGGTSMSYRRMLKLAVATLLMVTLLGMATPGFRALAQSWLAKVGIVTVTNETENLIAPTVTFDPTAPTSTPIPLDVADQIPTTLQEEGPVTNMTVAQAAELTGFDVVREPSYMTAGYVFNGRGAFGWGDHISVSTYYNVVGDHMNLLSISQSRGGEPYTIKAGSAATSHEVQVGEFTATYIANVDLQSSDGVLFNILLWEEGDYIFMMTSPSLDEAEMVAIANSLYE